LCFFFAFLFWMFALGALHSCSPQLFFGECFLFWLWESALRVLRTILVLLQLFSVWHVFCFLTLDVCSWCFTDYFCFFQAIFRSEFQPSLLFLFPFVEPQQHLHFLGLAFCDPSSSLIRICCSLLSGPTRTRLVRAC